MAPVPGSKPGDKPKRVKKPVVVAKLTEEEKLALKKKKEKARKAKV